ncbi:hypothetical protein HNR30_008042 [Nonomuraea soli]|uniref:Uncharacterized protein n=1 Tax=Nonomuraea soli TaxID=1032476 RepID=A0A7W0HVB8_9ACTN|nr:hypothetical protein [Nonomuraea soli]
MPGPNRAFQGRIIITWRKHLEHWGGGRQRPCRFCQLLASLLDYDGLPVHKVCLEQALSAAPQQAERYAA